MPPSKKKNAFWVRPSPLLYDVRARKSKRNRNLIRMSRPISTLVFVEVAKPTRLFVGPNYFARVLSWINRNYTICHVFLPMWLKSRARVKYMTEQKMRPVHIR